jgi:breast cancer 2 susceptibility protein
MEILDAYNSTRLVISGNSSHLAPWHAKLGFQTGPCISTLHHLNGDGGHVAVMAIVVIKVSCFIREDEMTSRR